MIPYHDENETQRTPIVTMLLIAVTALAWVFVQGAGTEFALAASICNLGLIPGELTLALAPGMRFPIVANRLDCVIDAGPQYLHLVTSMFLHGSWAHIIGNMWFLWLFGNNIEDSMTRPRFVAFYLLTGLAAALAQVLADPASPAPMVGASGAISGVMGAYLVLFPRVRVYTVVPIFLFLHFMAVPAWLMLVYWAFLQVIGGVTSVAAGAEGGVAFWAHLGGFVAGVVLVKLFERRDRVLAHTARTWRPHQPRGWY